MPIEQVQLRHQREYMERKAAQRRAAKEREPSTINYALNKVAEDLAPKRDVSLGSVYTDLPLDYRREACRKSILAWAMNCRPNSIKPYLHTRIIDRYLVRCFRMIIRITSCKSACLRARARRC